MSLIRRCWRGLLVALVVLGWLIGGSASSVFAQANWVRISLASGTVYEGQIARVAAFTVVPEVLDPYDASPHQVVVVNDEVRRIFFNVRKIAQAPVPVNDFRNPYMEIWQNAFSESGGIGYADQVISISPFNEFGHRTLVIVDGGNQEVFLQGISEISSRYVKIVALKGRDKGSKTWDMRMSPRSIPPAVLDSVLHRQIKDRRSAKDYWQIFDIYLNAGMYDLAQNELKTIGELFPDQAEVVETSRKLLRPRQADRVLNEIRSRNDAGQSRLAETMARLIVNEEMGDDQQFRFLDVSSEIDNARKRLEEVRQEVVTRIENFLETGVSTEQAPLWTEFRDELQRNLSLNNLARLEGYTRFLTDETITPEQRLAQVVSGWYLGSSGTMNNLAVAETFIPVYRLVREYLSGVNADRRQQILEEIKKFEGGAPEYVAAMIAQMPPPQAPDLTNYTGATPLKYTVDLPDLAASGTPPLEVNYFVQLPPEYDPYRKYPCLITLPSLGGAETQLAYWCGDYDPQLEMRNGQAGRFGYVVVAVDWRLPGQNQYGYSTREHMAVLKVLRQSLRQFSIDTDRVFLQGLGIGGEAAYDIAVSHPDLFAGVIGISAPMGKYIDYYKDNEHLGLSVYSVLGEKDILTARTSEPIFNEWLRRGVRANKTYVDLTVVEYIGRVVEDFYEEVPRIFEWMAQQRRPWPNLTDDLAFKCKILRPSDNQYWFLELWGMPADKIVEPEFWRTPGFKQLSMEVEKKGNRFFNLGPSKQGDGMVLSFSPEFVNFDQKIEISGRGSFKDFIKPSLQTLLEDVRTRGDRQHPFWARLIHDGRRWYPEFP